MSKNYININKFLEIKGRACIAFSGDGQILFHNKEFENLLGKQGQTHKEMNLFALVFEADQEVLEEYIHIKDFSKPIDIRFNLTSKKIVCIQLQATFSKKEKLFYAFLDDVTNEKKLLDTMRQGLLDFKKSDENLNIIVESLDDLVFEIDKNYLFINVWCKNDKDLLFPKSEIINRKITDLFPDEFSQKFILLIQEALKCQETRSIEYQFNSLLNSSKEQKIVSETETKWFRAKITPQKNKNKVTMLISDISREKKLKTLLNEKIKEVNESNKNLREIAHQVESVANNSPGMLYQFVLSSSGEVSFPYVSNKVIDIYEVYPHELKNTPDLLVKMAHPEDQNSLMAKIQESAEKMIKFYWKGRILTKKGEEKVLEVQSIPQKLPNGDILWDGLLTDITQTEKVTKKANALSELVNSAQEVFGLCDLQGKPQFINKYAQEVLGWSDQVDSIEAYMSQDTYKKYQNEIFPYILKTDRQWEGELPLLNLRKMEELPFLQRVFSIKNEKGQVEYFANISFDLSERKKQELSMLHSARLASLGEMSGGMAHEINNPLAIIEGKSSLLLKQLESGGEIDKPKFIDSLNKIIHTTGRISKIVSGLRKFSRGNEHEELKEVVFLDYLNEVLDLVREKFKANGVKLEIESLSEVKSFIPVVQFSQVIINLINNSYDSIAQLSDKWIKVSIKDETDTVVIDIKDSGKGVPVEVKDKIFDPFFTTKEVGKGTGLGLSLSKGIIESYGGRLYLNSTEKNTTFTIIFPKYIKNTEKVAA